jgi:hypothetical protein
MGLLDVEDGERTRVAFPELDESWIDSSAFDVQEIPSPMPDIHLPGSRQLIENGMNLGGGLIYDRTRLVYTPSKAQGVRIHLF